jgi:hypothetical protein
MAAAPEIHAPDGGIVGHSLCQNPAGDVTEYERDVTCPECLSELEQAGPELRIRMCKNGFTFAARQALPADRRRARHSQRPGHAKEHQTGAAAAAAADVERLLASHEVRGNISGWTRASGTLPRWTVTLHDGVALSLRTAGEAHAFGCGLSSAAEAAAARHRATT